MKNVAARRESNNGGPREKAIEGGLAGNHALGYGFADKRGLTP